MMNKTELVNGLHEEQAGWEALLAQIGEARMEQPGVAGPWSIKDIVAHLTGWRRRTVGRLQAGSRGEPEPPPPWPAHFQTADEINAWLYEIDRDRSLREVLQDSRQVFQQLVAAIEAFPEAELMDPDRFPWLEGQPLNAAVLFGHFHEEHEPDMRAWLAQQQSSQI
jgi:hypothetical protein